MQTRIRLIPCRPEDLEVGDIALVTRGLFTALLYLENRDGMRWYWFSEPQPYPKIAPRFIMKSPFSWNREQLAFCFASGEAALHVNGSALNVIRGAAKRHAEMFSLMSVMSELPSISGERIRELEECMNPTSTALSSLVMNGLGHGLVRHVQSVLVNLRTFPDDTQAVVLASIFAQVIGGSVAQAMQELRTGVDTEVLGRSDPVVEHKQVAPEEQRMDRTDGQRSKWAGNESVLFPNGWGMPGGEPMFTEDRKYWPFRS
jgi:hypothetical protein